MIIEPIPTLCWPDGDGERCLELVQLSPPSELTVGYQSAQRFLGRLTRREMGRSRGQVEAWITAASDRHTQRRRRDEFEAALRFLEGETLENAPDVFRRQLQAFYATSPGPRAAFFLIREVMALHPQAQLRSLPRAYGDLIEAELARVRAQSPGRAEVGSAGFRGVLGAVGLPGLDVEPIPSRGRG